MNTAQKVRQEKEAHPERFCKHVGCLWRVQTRNGPNPCRKHGGFVHDFKVRNEGTIFLLYPLTPAATEWVGEHIPEDAQTFGTGIVVEHRYITDIIAGIQNDGLTVGRF